MSIPETFISIVDWSDVAQTGHHGKRGSALQRNREFGEIRVRIAEHSAGLPVDHWCTNGHLIHLQTV